MSVLYFVSFVLLGIMVMLNLVIGVIINSMDEATAEAAEASLERAIHPTDTGSERLDALAAKLKEAQTVIEDLQRAQTKT